MNANPDQSTRQNAIVARRRIWLQWGGAASQRVLGALAVALFLLPAAATLASSSGQPSQAEIKANEGKLVDFFKQKGLTVTEVNKDEFRDTVLKNVSFESFDYRKADWERIQAVK